MLRTKSFWIAVIGILSFGAVLAAGDGSSAWLQGWLAFSLLLGLVVSILVVTWRAVVGVQAERSLLMAVTVALLLRLWLGSTLTQLLPQVGYPSSQEHQAGYVFTDAYVRDRQAWELANTGAPLTTAFSGQYSGDQYGGMLAVEAWLYRSLSLDAHRQTLILTLTAGAAALGVIFIWKAGLVWFGRKAAGIAAWIFALYPESVLLGSSQMREAFVISAVAITIYSLTLIPAGSKAGKGSIAWLGWLILGVAALALLQPPMLFISLGLLFIIWLLDEKNGLAQKRPRTFGIAILFVVLLAASLLAAASILANLPSLRASGLLGTFGDWLAHNFAFQTYLTERASGMFQKLLESTGEQWTGVLVAVYGIAQPVLPAIVGDPDAAPVMRWIGFFRAGGWYALAPFLVYGLLAAFRSGRENRRAQLIFLGISLWGWAVIAAFNGGADQWDTPRYRTLLLAWQALLAAWAWSWAAQRQDAWLGRWLAIELFFVAMFTEWYASRYFLWLPHLDIFITIAVTLVITALILGTSILRDYRKKRKRYS